MPWKEIHAELAKLFAEVAIDDPPATVVRVYEEPPASIEGDEPCVVIYPPEATVTLAFGQRMVEYKVTCLLLLRDEDPEVAARMISGFVQAVIDRFETDKAVTMGGVANAWLIDAKPDRPHGDVRYAGTSYVGFDYTLVIGDLQPLAE